MISSGTGEIPNDSVLEKAKKSTAIVVHRPKSNAELMNVSHFTNAFLSNRRALELIHTSPRRDCKLPANRQLSRENWSATHAITGKHRPVWQRCAVPCKRIETASNVPPCASQPGEFANGLRADVVDKRSPKSVAADGTSLPRTVGRRTSDRAESATSDKARRPNHTDSARYDRVGPANFPHLHHREWPHTVLHLLTLTRGKARHCGYGHQRRQKKSFSSPSHRLPRPPIQKQDKSLAWRENLWAGWLLTMESSHKSRQAVIRLTPARDIRRFRC